MNIKINVFNRCTKKGGNMKKAFTTIEIMIVMVILAIIASIALPGYVEFKKRIEYKEASGILELVRAGAKYYDLKYGIAALDPTAGPLWTHLKVDDPSSAHLVYSIVTGPAAGESDLQISNTDGDVLYTYTLPDGPGATTAEPDVAYLPTDLP